MAEPNAAELVAIYQHIKTHPEEWRQGWWGRRDACGTAFCFAGHAAVRAGAEPQWHASVDGVEAFDFVMTPDGNAELVDEFAARVLGLDLDEAGEEDFPLFSAVNDLDDLRRIIVEITGVDPEPAVA
jgi:hypothetical protein